jgi:hypothetical protein
MKSTVIFAVDSQEQENIGTSHSQSSYIKQELLKLAPSYRPANICWEVQKDFPVLVCYADLRSTVLKLSIYTVLSHPVFHYSGSLGFSKFVSTIEQWQFSTFINLNK